MSREDVREEDLYAPSEDDTLHGDAKAQALVEDLKRKRKRERIEWRDSYKSIMNTGAGRRFVWGVLAKANYFSGAVRYTTKEGGGVVDPLASMFQEGKRNLALELQQEAMTQHGIAENWIQMLIEGTRDRKEKT